MYISLNVPTDETLNNPVFFKIDDEIYETNYKNIDNIVYTEEKTEEVKKDSTSVNSYDNTTYSTAKKVRSEVNLNKNIIEKLIYGEKLNIRIYINESAYDMPFFNFKYETLKKFLTESSVDKWI